MNLLSIVWVLTILSKRFAKASFKCGIGVNESSVSILDGGLWPNSRIPYEIDSLLRDTDREVFHKAIEDYHIHTCLRFEPKTSNDTAYIQARINFGNVSYCGNAISCYTGSPQFVAISSLCSTVANWIHEIAHALCLGHEQSRMDRDEFLDFSDCSNHAYKPPSHGTLRCMGSLYDYYSQMHYGCWGACSGLPVMENVDKCGDQINKDGLSVLDADKINDYYNCSGCHRHRWYNASRDLTELQLYSLVNFGEREGDIEPVFLCRGYINGDISVGRYKFDNKTCEIHKKNYRVTEILTSNIQVFALSNGPSEIPMNSEATFSEYRLFSNMDTESRDFYVAVGRTRYNREIYAGVGEIEDADGKKETVVGRVDKDIYDIAWFPISDQYRLSEFEIIGCKT